MPKATANLPGGVTWSNVVRRSAIRREDTFDAMPTLYPATKREVPRTGVRSVRAAIVSPTWIVMIENPKFGDAAFLALPGGREEPDDCSIADTARREALQEAPIAGFGSVPALFSWRNVLPGARYPNDMVLFFISDELIETVSPVGDENGDKLIVHLIRRDKIVDHPDLRPDHRPLVEKILRELRARRL